MANATTWNGLKIAPRLRWKIRYRLLAIEYAQGHGLCAAERRRSAARRFGRVGCNGLVRHCPTFTLQQASLAHHE